MSSCQIHPLPEAYEVSWTNDASVTVTKQCLVAFSIGDRYEETIWCNVVPIKVAHIILGQSWKFKRKVVHNGSTNTYKFMYNVRKTRLLPMKVE